MATFSVADTREVQERTSSPGAVLDGGSAAAPPGAPGSTDPEGHEAAETGPVVVAPDALAWVRTSVQRLRASASGFVGRALALGADALDAGLELLAASPPPLSEEDADAIRPPERWDSDDLDDATLSGALLRVAARCATLAITQSHPARAELLALEAGLNESVLRRAGGNGLEKVELLWDQALDHAQQTGSVATACLACARLLTLAVGESRPDFAAYLAARLAETAEAAGDPVEGAKARLQEAHFWEQSGEHEAAWEAAQVGLEDACGADDRSLVTEALLATGRLASRSGGLSMAEEAFEGALGALSLGAESPALFAHACFGLATVAAYRQDWGSAFEHLEFARQHALEAGNLPLYARTVLAALDVNEQLGRSAADFLTAARRDATAAWGLGAATLFEGLVEQHAAADGRSC